MFRIALGKFDFLCVRIKNNGEVGYVRFNLRDWVNPSTFEKKEEAEKILDYIKTHDIEFVNDANPNSIVNGRTVDKNKLQIVEIK